jgi:hypothetical protein
MVSLSPLTEPSSQTRRITAKKTATTFVLLRNACIISGIRHSGAVEERKP